MTRSNLFLFSLFFGVASLMALSNAIIPILPSLNGALQIQTFIYSAYFFGAMITTLPGGIISDRIGQFRVVIAGMILTVLSGAFLAMVSDPVLILLIRLAEGIGAGLFVSASLSWINYQKEHARFSGIFMALLNLGLLLGLVGGGWITSIFGDLTAGIRFFTIISVIPVISLLFCFSIRNVDLTGASVLTHEDSQQGWRPLFSDVSAMIRRQAPLWFSVIVLLGITGFVQALYPDLSGLAASEVGTALAVMNLATIISSITAPWFRIEPVLLIRISAILMAILVLVFVQYPSSIFIMGFVAGLVMISQISYLAMAERKQGVAMGLYTTASYAGMTFLPAIGGYIAGLFSVSVAASLIALLAGICVITIGSCKCRGFDGSNEA
ncbi:MAG TPA: MFS transporter [Methanospirillum sp.]|uniref:MFS transporter n=1 Tax=Methanospirillum sp. TaxID=45200 RepID=UPI002C4EA25A|nr:MFS transporter [Methanospirillum sp.]HWQ63529.1 MFS transporter [Methanospirillum sp.]